MGSPMVATICATSIWYHFSRSLLLSDPLKMASVVDTKASKLDTNTRMPHF